MAYAHADLQPQGEDACHPQALRVEEVATALEGQVRLNAPGEAEAVGEEALEEARAASVDPLLLNHQLLVQPRAASQHLAHVVARTALPPLGTRLKERRPPASK